MSAPSPNPSSPSRNNDNPHPTNKSLTNPTHTPNKPKPTTPAQARQAALAAAEARFRTPITPASDVKKDDGSKEQEEVWTPPSEVEDINKKKEFGRLLDRGIVRDNGYAQAAACCEVSFLYWE